MNIHVQEELKKRWSQYEFKGKTIIKNGKKYIRAYHKILKLTHLYDFEKDWFEWYI